MKNLLRGAGIALAVVGGAAGLAACVPTTTTAIPHYSVVDAPRAHLQAQGTSGRWQPSGLYAPFAGARPSCAKEVYCLTPTYSDYYVNPRAIPHPGGPVRIWSPSETKAAWVHTFDCHGAYWAVEFPQQSCTFTGDLTITL